MKFINDFSRYNIGNLFQFIYEVNKIAGSISPSTYVRFLCYFLLNRINCANVVLKLTVKIKILT